MNIFSYAYKKYNSFEWCFFRCVCIVHHSNFEYRLFRVHSFHSNSHTISITTPSKRCYSLSHTRICRKNTTIHIHYTYTHHCTIAFRPNCVYVFVSVYEYFQFHRLRKSIDFARNGTVSPCNIRN